MKIKIIAPPVIDVSWLMRSPQSDIGILYGMLKTEFHDDVSMKDYRFFYYDDFYSLERENTTFKKERFFEHKDIMDVVSGKSSTQDEFYRSAYSLYNSIKDSFDSTDYLIVPISIFEQFSLEYFLSGILMAYFFHKENPKSKIILFGTYRSIYAQITMKNFDFIDGIVKKWDKHSIAQMIHAFEQDNIEAIENAIFVSSAWVKEWEEYNVDINTDWYPDYSGFDLEVHKQEEDKLVLSYELWQWCRNNCFYCYNVHKWGNYFVKDVSKIADELERLQDEYKTDLFHFDDNEINYSNTFLHELSEEICRRNIRINWTALIIPRELEKDLLQKLYNAWCRQLRFWIESGSQKMLNIIWKKTTVTWIEEILTSCTQIWIQTYATFIVDLPQETQEDIDLTLRFIHRNQDFLKYIVICAYNTHLWTFDVKYFNHLLGNSDYSFDRTKRISRKKLLLRKFSDTLWKYDVDVIQFMKHHLWK